MDKKGRVKIPDNIIAMMNIGGGQRLKVRQTEAGFEIYNGEDEQQA